LGVENFIVAFDWDDAGKSAIRKISGKIGCDVFYLGGLQHDQDPADKLQDRVSCINGFSLRHLLEGAKKAQDKTDKPVSFSFLPACASGADEVCFKPGMVLKTEFAAKQPGERKYDKFYYDADAFLPLLNYDHVNKSELDKKLHALIGILENGSPKKGEGRQLMIYGQFIYKKIYLDLGPGLILWLKLAIEQQYRRRKVQIKNSLLAEWLNTSGTQVIKYKNRLKEMGFLNIDTSTKIQKLSVNFFPVLPGLSN